MRARNPSSLPEVVDQALRDWPDQANNVTVFLSDHPGDEVAAGKIMDGDVETYWKGTKDALMWWILLVYDNPRVVQNIDLLLGEGSLPVGEQLGSLDAKTWLSVEAFRKEPPVPIPYVWIGFSANDSESVPVVHELKVEE